MLNIWPESSLGSEAQEFCWFFLINFFSWRSDADADAFFANLQQFVYFFEILLSII